MSQTSEKTLHAELERLAAAYYELYHKRAPFVPGETYIPYAGRVFDVQELIAAAASAFDFWLTLGPIGENFEKQLAKLLRQRSALMVNSGSSANLVAFSTLCSPLLENHLRPGDEVITVAAGFPTTVNPILQNNCIPVFVDIDRHTLNIDVTQLEAALSPRTRAVMVAHTLGNPFDLESVTAFCQQHNLWLVEDNCDGLGSLYQEKPTGSFGDLATMSFYPAHHITSGEGGAIVCKTPLLRKVAAGIRDWGRDCWCKSGKDNTCGKRFDAKYGTLPHGYDHKYVYSQIGYNLKPIEISAAIALAQLKKLPDFVQKRRENYDFFANVIREIPWLHVQQATHHAQPSWFGCAITVDDDAPIDKATVVSELEAAKIQTRHLFAGNLLRHPAYQQTVYRRLGTLTNTERIMRQTFFIGVYPGIGEAERNYIAEILLSLKNKSAITRTPQKPKTVRKSQQPTAHSAIVREDLESVSGRLAEVASSLEASNIVITGATGTIGSYLVLALDFLNREILERPCHVTAISRNLPDANHLLHGLLSQPHITFLKHDANSVPEDLKSVDYLILAATKGAPADYLRESVETLRLNSYGLFNWFDFAKACGTKSALYVSTGEIYGSPDASNVPTKESYIGTMDHLLRRSVYAEAKRFGETIAMDYHHRSDLPVTIARPYQIFGPGIRPNDARALPSFLYAAASKQHIKLDSPGLARRTFMYLADAVVALLTVLLKGQHGNVYNVGTSTPEVSIVELAKLIAANAETMLDTKVTVDVATASSETAKHSPKRTCPDISRLEQLSFTPQYSLEDIVARTLSWIIQESKS